MKSCPPILLMLLAGSFLFGGESLSEDNRVHLDPAVQNLIFADITSDDSGGLIALEEETGRLHFFSPEGKLIRHLDWLSEDMAAVASLKDLLWVDGQLWVSNFMDHSITRLKDDKVVGRIKPGKKSFYLSRMGDKVLVWQSPLPGIFRVYHSDGTVQKQFDVAIPNPNDRLGTGFEKLWAGIAAAPMPDGRVFVGFTFDNKTAVVDTNGKVSDLKSMDDAYTYNLRGGVPFFFSASDFEVSPKGAIWLAAATVADRDCNRVLAYDLVGKKTSPVHIIDGHIKKIRFLNKGALVAFVNGDGKTLLYKLP